MEREGQLAVALPLGRRAQARPGLAGEEGEHGVEQRGVIGGRDAGVFEDARPGGAQGGQVERGLERQELEQAVRQRSPLGGVERGLLALGQRGQRLRARAGALLESQLVQELVAARAERGVCELGDGRRQRSPAERAVPQKRPLDARVEVRSGVLPALEAIEIGGLVDQRVLRRDRRRGERGGVDAIDQRGERGLQRALFNRVHQLGACSPRSGVRPEKMTCSRARVAAT